MQRFVREIFMNSADDVLWLQLGHLKNSHPPDFLSFTLAGNEDSPRRLDLYASRKPEYNEQPVAVYTQNDEGELDCPEYPNNPAPVVHKVIRRTRKG